MRTLGYPRIILSDNFRQPNFTLVADCLEWLVRRYDQGLSLAGDIDTSANRILFLQTVGRTMFAKARIKLNLKVRDLADPITPIPMIPAPPPFLLSPLISSNPISSFDLARNCTSPTVTRSVSSLRSRVSSTRPVDRRRIPMRACPSPSPPPPW